MSSISTTISSIAASNPIVGSAVAYASKQSQLLATLSGNTSTSTSLQNLLTAANTQSAPNITVLPTATSSTTSTASGATSSTDSTATSATAASASDLSGSSAVAIADNQSAESSQLIASLTGAGGTFSGIA